MRLFVNGLNACPLYVVNYEMIEWMDNEMDRYIWKALLNFFILGALTSYWTASLRKPKIIPDIPNGQVKDMCNQCRAWKPERAHHCQFCGRCVPKMDHHCPWIGNCVGYHNQKPFFLFCFYQTFSAIVFFALLVKRINAPDDIPDLSTIGEICYWVTVVLDMPIGFALIGLSVSIFLQIYEN